MKTGIEIIQEERIRQVSVENYSDQSDDLESKGEMAGAAACYALNACGFSNPHILESIRPPVVSKVRIWPWAEHYWKPSSQIRDLAKAGALIAAEIDRLQRIKERLMNEASCPECKSAKGHKLKCKTGNDKAKAYQGKLEKQYRQKGGA